MIEPKNVHATLEKYQLADGFPVVLDLEGSHGSWLRDAVKGEEHLDFFTCFASWPIGYGHPRMQDPEFKREMEIAGLNNPANSDLYTESMAKFVEAFATKVTPAGFDHHFWVQGGALAVENALKTAFDWKARKLGYTDFSANVNDLVVLHFREAFHGRSGYTMSLTNTDPAKIGLFPKFDWPRVHNPYIELDYDGNISNDVEASERRAVQDMEAAFKKHKGKVAAILIEPMQGEGGDNHFRHEFFLELRRLADENEALLVYDEVQTGFWGSGEPWYWQTKCVAPDVVAFGKKTQICGIYAGPRIDEVADNVFSMSSRINSTWGGNLIDMVRCRKFIEIILEDDLPKNVVAMGERFIAGLRELGRDKGTFTNVRGIGSLIAFTCETPAARNDMLQRIWAQKLLALASGERGIRFRTPFTVTSGEIDIALERIAASLPATV